MAREDALVGRDDAVAAVRAAVDRSSTGRQVVLVTGDAGLGKTSLLRHALAGPSTMLVWSSGDESEIEVEHGVVEQLVRGSRLRGSVRAELLDATGADPLRVGSLLVQVVDGLDLPRHEPLIVVVDDVQWADEASLVALGFALRRLRNDPVVLCLATRPDGVDRLPTALTRLVADEGTAIALGPLGVADVRHLAERSLGQPVTLSAAERLREHTGGSPLHLETLLDELDAPALLATGPLPSPREYGSLILARLGGAAAEVEALALAVAVLGDHTPVAVAAELAQIEDPGPSVDAGVALDVLRAGRDDVGGLLLSPAHPLVRAALLGDVPPGRLAALHGRAGELLPGPVGLRHRLQGTLGSSRPLFEEAVASAATEGRAGAHGTAASILRAARRVAPDDTARVHGLLAMVDQLLLAGRVDAAAEFREQIDELPSAPLRDLVAARLSYVLGPRTAAKPLLERAWAAMQRQGDDGGRALRSRIAANLAILSVDRAEGAEALHWCRVALDTDPSEAAQLSAGHMLASASALAGSYEEGLAELRRRAGPPDGRANSPEVVDLRSGLGLLHLWCHNLDDASAELSAALQAGSSATFVARESVRSYLAEVEYRAGRWDEAIQLVGLACSLIDDSDQLWMAALPHVTAARVHAPRGGPAAMHLARAREAVRLAGGGVASGLTAVGTLEVAVCQRDVAAGLAAGSILGRARVGVDDRIASWRANHAELLAESGDLAGAAAAIDELRAIATNPLLRTELARAAVVLADRADDLDALDRASSAGLTEAASEAGPYPRARFELAIGSAWRRRGRRRDAAEQLEQASERFAALQAVPWLERTAAEVRALGLRPRRDPGARTELTPQEWAVARLVAEGRTNREVASELVVSAKTVEHHLSRIYAKLGIRSRTELARRLPPG